MKSNTIPKSKPAVTSLALRTISGAQAHGSALLLTHNSAAHLVADFFALMGDPSTPLIPGAQALLNAQLLAMKTTHAAALAALKAGRDFCHTALGVLKPILGQRWNGQWLAEGFTAGSLAVAATPLAMLVQFRAYFTAHPERAGASLGLTAAGAQARIEAIQAALQARATARGARWSVKATRDAAFKQLRKRLSALRAELAQLMPPTDDRWYAFGFRRPADGKVPAPVQSLTLTAGAPGVVLVNWPASSGAENYRVTWQSTTGSEPAMDAGLFAGTQAALQELPSGWEIVVRVSARNAAGETTPAEATIMVT